MFHIVALASSLLVAPPKFDAAKLPYRAQWGRYVVSVERLGKELFSPYRIRVRDANGRVVREIEAARLDNVAFVPFTSRTPDTLHISADASTGNYPFVTEFFFTRQNGVRNALIADIGMGGVSDIRDRDGDGRAEFVSSVQLGNFGDFAHVYYPSVTHVFGWNGTRYADQTRRFPKPALQSAQEYQQSYREALKDKEEGSDEARRSALTGYFVCMMAAGREPEAQTWMQANATGANRRWLLARRTALRQAVAAVMPQFRVSQATKFDVKME